jgi:hypothetical protein
MVGLQPQGDMRIARQPPSREVGPRLTATGLRLFADAIPLPVQGATLFCAYFAVATSAGFAGVTLARMSLVRAVQMNGYVYCSARGRGLL